MYLVYIRGMEQDLHDCFDYGGPSGQLQRVSITDSFGANPVSSAMDHCARRDPGRAKPQYQTPLRGLNPKPCTRTLQQGKTITSSANPVGRF
jgi:hypothetical protein